MRMNDVKNSLPPTNFKRHGSLHQQANFPLHPNLGNGPNLWLGKQQSTFPTSTESRTGIREEMVKGHSMIGETTITSNSQEKGGQGSSPGTSTRYRGEGGRRYGKNIYEGKFKYGKYSRTNNSTSGNVSSTASTLPSRGSMRSSDEFSRGGPNSFKSTLNNSLYTQQTTTTNPPPILPPKTPTQSSLVKNCMQDHNNTNNKSKEKIIDTRIIEIHVFDESKGLQKDFKCEKNLILDHMKYFEKFIEGTTSLDDMDISVHCDIHIFEWLVKYIQNPIEHIKLLQLKDAISILISSDFLQMPSLVDLCIHFIQEHLLEVVRLPIDMNCISSRLLKRIIKPIDVEVLDELKDRKDKLISKLYMKKLEMLFENEENMFSKCVYCNEMFTRAQKTWMICPKANIFIDFHGNVIAEHLPDPSWDINHFITFLRKNAISWREIYWKIWGRLIDFQCNICDKQFIGAHLAHCSYHPQSPKYTSGANSGQYPCCKTNAIRFHTKFETRGCHARNHVIKSTKAGDLQKDYVRIESRIKVIGEPYLSEQKYEKEFEELLEIVNINSRLGVPNAKNIADTVPMAKIKDSIPLSIMLYKYSQISSKIGKPKYSEDEEEDNVSESGDLRSVSPDIKQSGKYKNMIKKCGGDYPINQRRKWRLEELRGNTRVDMKEITKQLCKVRGDELGRPKAKKPKRPTTQTPINNYKNTVPGGRRPLPTKTLPKKPSKGAILK